MAQVPIHKPFIYTDGGPWAEHDVACPVCQENKAMLNLNTGVFEPCGQCRANGWVTKKKRWRKRP